MLVKSLSKYAKAFFIEKFLSSGIGGGVALR